MEDARVTAAVSAVEKQLRKHTGTAKGRISIRSAHVKRIRDSNADKSVIGKPRGDVVWMAIAQLTTEGRHKNLDMTLPEGHVEVLKMKGLAALGVVPKGRADREEMQGAVMGWLEENEEVHGSGMYLIRPGKLTQLKNARKATAKLRGGPMAIMAAITLLSAEGDATLQYVPRQPANKGPWSSWVEDTVVWMVGSQWITQVEAASIQQRAETVAGEHAKEEPEKLILNKGEGWRSVARAVETLFPRVRVVGADKRGFTYVGALVGTITAELKHDWSDQSSDLITALSKKAGVSVKSWDLIAFEPECTLFSTGNSMNIGSGTAHGKWALTDQNTSLATPERLQMEARKYEDARKGVMAQLESLERHPYLLFLMENPADSELWELPEVIEILQRNTHWIIHVIDRCAYGREEKKPTKIMTNSSKWRPKGRTGNGRCCAGKCTGWRVPSGQTKHPRQTIANDKAQRVDCGKLVGGRREWSPKAVVNALEPELIKEAYQEILGIEARGPVGGPIRTIEGQGRSGRTNRKRPREGGRGGNGPGKQAPREEA